MITIFLFYQNSCSNYIIAFLWWNIDENLLTVKWRSPEDDADYDQIWQDNQYSSRTKASGCHTQMDAPSAMVKPQILSRAEAFFRPIYDIMTWNLGVLCSYNMIDSAVNIIDNSDHTHLPDLWFRGKFCCNMK